MFSTVNNRLRPAIWAAVLALASACSPGTDSIVSPNTEARHDVVSTPSTGLVISQVYGGGGNAGATLKADFIELYNGTSADISLSGYSVQYASAAGTSWQVTSLNGTIQSGHYYLIQESFGAGGTVDLPTPNATGNIPMSGTSGKVALVKTTSALSGTGCPFANANVVDYVGFGAANCFEGAAGTPALTNTTAAIRKDGGRTDANENGADFATGNPTPRNTFSAPLPPLNALIVTIAPTAPAVSVGAIVNFTATASQGGTPVAVTSATWTSSDATVATIDQTTGVATAVAIGTSTIGVTAVTASGTVSSTATLTVSGVTANVVVTPATWSLKSAQTKVFTAAATDAGGNAVTTTFTWSSSNTAIATIDANTGLATGKAVGQATITATSANNVTGTATIIVTAGNIVVQSRADALPVGFQTQFFVNNGGTDAAGNPVGNADVLWSSSNTSILTVDANTGVVTAKSAGQATLTATAKSDGISSGSTTVTTEVQLPSATARTGHNVELGTPTDADPSDDIIIARRNYTLSYNVSHGGPNWVSWNLDASHKGSASRCNCFTADTALTRLGIKAYDTNDWINGGIYSRGHLSPSADWAVTAGDNAPTFFLSNMLPQNQTANAGAWGDLENYLRTLATGSAQIYIVAGGIFTKNRSGAGVDGLGFMSGLGKIAVPDSLWKVAVVVPDTRNVNGITSASDVQVIAINMPNDASGSGTYNRYLTTVDKIQRSTGYDFLNALPETIQCRIETRNCAPVAVISPVGAASEGVAIPFSAASSTDPENDALSYAWTFGDGASAIGVAPSHVFANNGTYTVTLKVTDSNGAQSTATASVVVSNSAPVVTATPPASWQAGVSKSIGVSFTDANAKDAPFTARINWGDGTANTSFVSTVLPTSALQKPHTYAASGSYTITITVTDRDGGVGTTTLSIIVP